MTFFEDAARAIPATARLFRFDPSGMGGLNLTLEGFLRSFLLVVPVGLVFYVLTRIEYAHVVDRAAIDTGLTAFVAVKLIGFVVDWFAFPLVMIPIAHVLGLGRGYVPLIVAINWMSVIAITLWTVPAILFAGGVIGEAATAFLSLVAFVYVVSVTGFVVRTALDTTAPVAVAITLFYLLLSLVIGIGADRLAGVQ